MKLSPPRSDAHFPPPPPPPPAPSLGDKGLGSLPPGATARLSPLLLLGEEEENCGPGSVSPRQWGGGGGATRGGVPGVPLVPSRRAPRLSLGSRSASADQTSDPARLGRGLRIGPAGGPRAAGGGGRGGVSGGRRRGRRGAPPVTPAPPPRLVPGLRASGCGAREPNRAGLPCRGGRPPVSARDGAASSDLGHAAPRCVHLARPNLTLCPCHPRAEPDSAPP